jgi:acyl dehydratase
VLTLEEAVARARQYVGVAGPAVSLKVERSAIRRFSESIGDANPLYHDEEFARATRWGGVIAPPTFLCLLLPPLPVPEVEFGTVRLNGGSGFELFRSVRPGDVIIGQAEFADVQGKEGSRGGMLISHRRTRYTDEAGRLVAIGTGTEIQA